MRVLFLHADHFSYEVTGETSISKQLDPIPPGMNKGSAKEALVCMISIEKVDGEKAESIVIGDKEIGSPQLPVRIRGAAKPETITAEQVCEYFDGEMKDKVFRPLNLPGLVSLRPIFRG